MAEAEVIASAPPLLVRRQRGWRRLVPSSLLGRLTLVMVAGVLISQVIGNLVWANQVRQKALTEAIDAATHVGGSAASALRFFKSLPPPYRPILIDQLREMGGTRFFVSVNRSAVSIDPIMGNELVDRVRDRVAQTLLHEYPRALDYRVSMAWPDKLPVSDDGVTLDELPDGWVQNTLVVKPRPAPILVIQAEIEPDNWVYLAALMPDPYFLDADKPLPVERLGLLLATVAVVLLLCLLVVRWMTRPFAQLAEAAESFGQGVTGVPLPESGSREFIKTARAFNAMQARIQRYLEDRERLFTSISHDLRTPITRLKLRAEMLDDEQDRVDFHEDLDELDVMVKGALQSVKDSDIHENPVHVRLDKLIQRLVDGAHLAGRDVAFAAGPVTVQARPLALKRAVGNLLDNALFYGERAEVLITRTDALVELTIRDYGPGVPEEALPSLFQPYVRLEHGRSVNTQGMGLGLGIARSIVHAHGGELFLANHATGGLVATILLPIGKHGEAIDEA
ncbi:ATP-binding protein [Amantichitinum ursilacus]|uniref:histidine kinase n=1 Tax=Amantichitinum ursilacus TaxID=857265 RepID=A0A0N0XJJ9_9NEIS|nr:ATP-binding protein [Amantichitinum ursilacus]KPC53675.1 Osmolarity sensor protein EnvZ [Amantichitinum ursilacus]